MIYVAVIEAIALVALAATFAGIVRSLIRQYARERELLINQMLHQAGRTWTPPPAEPLPEPEPLRLLRNVDQMAPEDRL